MTGRRMNRSETFISAGLRGGRRSHAPGGARAPSPYRLPDAITLTCAPGRTRDCPSTTTRSPSATPRGTTVSLVDLLGDRDRARLRRVLLRRRRRRTCPAGRSERRRRRNGEHAALQLELDREKEQLARPQPTLSRFWNVALPMTVPVSESTSLFRNRSSPRSHDFAANRSRRRRRRAVRRDARAARS